MFLTFRKKNKELNNQFLVYSEYFSYLTPFLLFRILAMCGSWEPFYYLKYFSYFTPFLLETYLKV